MVRTASIAVVELKLEYTGTERHTRLMLPCFQRYTRLQQYPTTHALLSHISRKSGVKFESYFLEGSQYSLSTFCFRER